MASQRLLGPPPSYHAYETSPLLRQGERRRTSITLIAIIFIAFASILMVILMVWGPYLLSGVAMERYKWAIELQKHHLDERLRMEKWEREFEDRKRGEEEQWSERKERERLREEQWRREEEERQRLSLYWAKPEPNAQCTAYNTRDYRARLLNTLPYDYNWLKPCEDIPIVIHNRSMLTTRCEINQNGLGEVYGLWRVNFDEPACTPYWDQFKDKGCIAEGSHRRRIEAHLENVGWGEDGEKLCASAPHDFYERHFDHPDSCANWGKYGIFGIWDIDDPDC